MVYMEINVKSYLVAGVRTDVEVILPVIDPIIDMTKPLPDVDPNTIAQEIISFGEISAQGVVKVKASSKIKVKVSVGVKIVDGPVGPAIVVGSDGGFLTVEPTMDDEEGMTVEIKVKFEALIENTIIMSSAGDIEEGTGMVVVFSGGFFHVKVMTTTHIYRCKFERVEIHRWFGLAISFSKMEGISVHIDSKFVVRSSIGIKRMRAASVSTLKSSMTVGKAVGYYMAAKMTVARMTVSKAVRTKLIQSGQLVTGLCSIPIHVLIKVKYNEVTLCFQQNDI